MSDDLIEKVARAIFNARLMTMDVAVDSARAALAAIEASGTHVVVPKEPTYEMLAEADSAIPRFEAHDGHRMMGVDGAELCWNTMLSARPPLPETEGKG